MEARLIFKDPDAGRDEGKPGNRSLNEGRLREGGSREASHG
jgi:hypothetical protein